MFAYRVETSIDKDGCLTLKGLPFKAGDTVEVIILKNSQHLKKNNYPLHGKTIRYEHPTEPVAQSDWESIP